MFIGKVDFLNQKRKYPLVKRIQNAEVSDTTEV